MKKLLSVVLTLIMLFSMIATASAKTIAEYTDDFIPNPMEMPLDVSVLAQDSILGGGYSNELVSTVLGDNSVGIDYQATLDMEPIRILFDTDFIKAVLTDGGGNVDATAMQEFGNGTVTTTVNVVIDYPATAIINGDLSTAGDLIDKNGIFTEKSRSVDSLARRVTITYVNESGLKVSKLQTNIEKYLADLTFELPSVISYSQEGAHKVTVTLSGSTSIAFASKTQTVIYNGKGSQTTNITRDYEELEHILVTVPGKVATCFDGGWEEGTICSTHNSGDLYDLNNPGYSCNVPGIHTPEALEKLNHKIGGTTLKTEISRVEPTCTTKGMKQHWTCSLCKSDFDSVNSDTVVPHEDYILDMLPHTAVTDSGFAATCAKPGYTDGKHCSVCNRVIVPQTLIPVLTTHTSVVFIGENKDATCTETGSIAGRKCNECDKVFESPKVIPATGHDYGDWELVQEATSTVKGRKKRVCKNDASHVEYADIPVSQHTIHEADPERDEVVKAATCTEPGVKKQFCSCGQLVNDNVQIPATGHTLSKVSAIAATCVVTGIVEHYHCEVCGKNYRNIDDTVALNDITQSIDKHNHPDNQKAPLPTIEATCISVGFTGGEMCRACNRIINTDTNPRITVPYASHKNETVEAIAATCTESGVKEHLHCAVCNKDFDMDGTTQIYESDFIIPAKGHKFGESLADRSNPPVNGFYPGTKTCDEYGCGATKNVKVPVDKNNCNHSFTETVGSEQHTVSSIVTEVVTPPTCTTEGVNREICSFCDKVKENNIPVPKLSHDLTYVNRVEPTCLTTGVEAYWQCNSCHGIFHHEDASLQINAPAVLDKTEHQFRIIGNGNNKQCIHCKELVHIKKKDKEGNETNNVAVSVVSHGHISHSEDDMARATVLEGIAEIPSIITIEEKKEVSPKLDEAIGKDVDYKKYVVDINIEKVTTYLENPTIETEKEEITQTDDFITFEITIPEEMWKDKNIVDYRVHRLHWNDVSKTDEVEILSTVENALGECIWVDAISHKVKIKVKKFSEYAVVAHTTKVNPDPVTPPTSGGSSSCTIKLNANGGTLLNNVTVKRGEKAVLPTPTRSGYVFAGWYLDNNFTTPFDTEAVVNRNYTLYAKWVAIGECSGTVTDNCPCLNYTDLDPSLWYHVGVDYVLNRGMMIGVSNSKFAPSTNVTRAMLVTVLWRAEGKPAAGNTTFTDLEDGQYYVDAVKWASANGVVNGYSDTTFAPNAAITREQFAAIMYRYAKAKGYDVSVGENTNILSYTDYSKISEYAIEAMQYTLGSGLIKGRTESTLNPKDNTTRAEMATILYRFFTESK